MYFYTIYGPIITDLILAAGRSRLARMKRKSFRKWRKIKAPVVTSLKRTRLLYFLKTDF